MYGDINKDLQVKKINIIGSIMIISIFWQKRSLLLTVNGKFSANSYLITMYSMDECTSSSTSTSHKQSKSNSDNVATRSNDTLSRKRTAARQLPRIMLHPSVPQGGGTVNSLTVNDFSKGILLLIFVYVNVNW